MPIPKPRKGEKHDKYISRAIRAIAKADPNMPDKQRVAIAFSTWSRAKKGGKRR